MGAKRMCGAKTRRETACMRKALANGAASFMEALARDPRQLSGSRQSREQIGCERLDGRAGPNIF